MITPQDVWNRNINIQPYEKQIDDILGAPWTEEMKTHGRRVSLILSSHAANSASVLAVPADTQRERLREKYTKSGWVFHQDKKDENTWVFEFPKGKTP